MDVGRKLARMVERSDADEADLVHCTAVTRPLSYMALMTKALPVSVWQLVQWQQWTNIGAAFSR